MRAERCACGGWIRVEDGSDWGAVAAAVLAHNRGPMHRAYLVGVAYVDAPDPADWHYAGGRSEGTLVPRPVRP